MSIAEQLSQKMFERFQDIKHQLNSEEGEIDSLSISDEKFIRAFHAAESNGRSVYEFLLYADSPQTIEEIYFSPQYFEMIFKDIRSFVQRMKKRLNYTSADIKNPYRLVDKSLARKLFFDNRTTTTSIKKKRCPNGTRRNKKTQECEKK